MGVMPGQWSTPKMRIVISCAGLGCSGPIPNYFPCDSLEFMLHTIFFTSSSCGWKKTCIHLFGEKENFPDTLQMLSHCPCHGREGKIVPLTALPPKIQLSETLLRHRHSTENFSPRGECLGRLWGSENKWDWIESDSWPQCQCLLRGPRAGIACDRLKAILLTPLTQINQRPWKFWFIDHIFLHKDVFIIIHQKASIQMRHC